MFEMSANDDNHTFSHSYLAACLLMFTEQNGWDVKRKKSISLVSVLHINSPEVYTAIEMVCSINNACFRYFCHLQLRAASIATEQYFLMASLNAYVYTNHLSPGRILS
jgi:hypothetical protein